MGESYEQKHEHNWQFAKLTPYFSEQIFICAGMCGAIKYVKTVHDQKVSEVK